MESHPVTAIFPEMAEDEYHALVEDIRENGLREPIWTYRGQIIDGRNRWRACSEVGIEPRTVEYTGDEGSLVSVVVSLNLHRRHLTESQRAVIAAKLANMPAGRPGRNSANLPSFATSQAEAAEALNVSPRTLRYVKAIEERAPELIERIARGEMTVNRALTEAKRAEVIGKLQDTATKQAKPCDGVYDVIVVDPPWPMEKIEREAAPNQVAFDYPTMTVEEIAALKLPAADHCHVWLWTTQKFLPHAFTILAAWGVKYVCTFNWHKRGGFQPFNLPQYNNEFAVYGRIGCPLFVTLKDFKTSFEGDRGKHSEKPEEFYAMVRRVTAGRRLDMFNRRNIEGFEGWGLEAP